MLYSKELLDEITKLASIYLADRDIFYSSKHTIPDDYETEYRFRQSIQVEGIVICSNYHPYGYKDVGYLAWQALEVKISRETIHGRVLPVNNDPRNLIYVKGNNVIALTDPKENFLTSK